MSDNRKPLISVIVPIYNVEKYLERCLSSIQKQTLTDFEVLMINDGTPDDSVRIASKFEKDDTRFILFNKKNTGVGMTRNFGIQHSHGDYLVFIDSDDFISPEYLEVLYRLCIDKNADISVCRYFYFFENSGKTFPMPFLTRRGVFDRDSALKRLLHDLFMRSFPWNKMYKRELFTENNISFPALRCFEDVAAMCRLFFNSERVAVTSRYLYHYVKHSESAMSTLNAEKLGDFYHCIIMTRNYIKAHGEYDKFRRSINFFANKAYIANVYNILQMHSRANNREDLKKNLRINGYLCKFTKSPHFFAMKDTPPMPNHFIQPEKKEKA